MQSLSQLAARVTALIAGLSVPGPRHAVHRSIVVVDIVQSTDPMRLDGDRVVIRDAMYDSLGGAFRWHDWIMCYHEDRGDGVLVLVPPEVPKDWLVTNLPERLETALVRHNAYVAKEDPERAAATQVKLRIAVNAGEVTFDRHGVVGVAIDETFRMADAPQLKKAIDNSPGVCALIVSDWFYHAVVHHQLGARPDSYQRVDCQVKQTWVSAWMRVPVRTLVPREQPRVLETA